MRIVLVASLCLSWLVGCENGTYRYVRCTSGDGCEGRSDCTPIPWRDGSGSMCTHACTTMSECPSDGRCLDVTGEFFCFDACNDDVDCGPGFLCQPLSLGGAVCLPSG